MKNNRIFNVFIQITLALALLTQISRVTAATEDSPPQTQPIVAFIGSTDIHHQQKNYNSYLSGKNEFYESVAWKGDVLNSKIVVLTKDKSVHNLTITASDFVNGQQDKINSNNVKVTWLKDIQANLGRGQLNSAPSEAFPDVLYTTQPINADAKKVNAAWINVQIPRDAKPGIYTGTLSVKASEMTAPINFTYTYEVLDLTLPDVREADTQIELWQHPFVSARYYGISRLNDVNNSNWFNEEHRTYLNAMMKEYAAIGGRGVVATIVEEAWNHQSYDNDPSMVKWTKKKDGTFTYNYDLFDKWIQLNIDAGVLDPETGYGQIKSYSIVPWENQITYFDEASGQTKKEKLTPGSDAWKKQWTSVLSHFIEHVDQKGWLGITYISMDERPISQLQPAVSLIQSIESNSGKKFKISSAMNFEAISDYDFLDKIDDISIDLVHLKNNDAVRKLAEHRQEKGLLTTVYTATGDAPNSNTISMPVESDWVLWYSMSQHLSGFMRWSYDGWTQNPLDNVNYKYWEAGDPLFIYPGDRWTDTYFRSSPRFERLKEGIRDINKAKYLMTLSADNKTRVQTLVDSLQRPPQGGNGWGAAVLPTDAARALVIGETRRMKDGINTVAKAYLNSRTQN